MLVTEVAEEMVLAKVSEQVILVVVPGITELTQRVPLVRLVILIPNSAVDS